MSDKRCVRTIGYVLLAIAVAAVPVGAGQISQRSADDIDPADLVQQLGDPHFAVRERAMSQLVQYGPDALEALEEGCRSEDREVRFRAQRALELVKADVFQRRLRAFAAGNELADQEALPCWELFQKQVGGSPQARRLFVEMQKAEPKLLRSLARSPSKCYDDLANRVQAIQLAIRYQQDRTQIEMGSVAAFLFVANNLPRRCSLQTAQYLSACFHFPTFRSALENGEERDLLRTMLGRWIGNTSGWTAYQGIMLAMQYDIPEGLIAAKRLLKETANQPNQPYFRFYALSAIGRFGSKADIPIVEPFLDDKSPYATAMVMPGQRKKGYRTQIRDVALAVVVHLAKKNPKDFGFDRIRKNGSYLFDPSSLAFANDQQRDKAIEKWRAMQAKESRKTAGKRTSKASH